MSSFGSSISRRSITTTKSTFGSRKSSTTGRPSSGGSYNGSGRKKSSGSSSGKNKKTSSVEKRNPPGFEKKKKLGEGGFGVVWDCKMKTQHFKITYLIPTNVVWLRLVSKLHSFGFF